MGRWMRPFAAMAVTWMAPRGLPAQQEPAAQEPPSYVSEGRAPEGKCLVYLHNKSGWTVFNPSQQIKIDGRKVAGLPRNTWTAVVLEAGMHQIQAGPRKPTPFEAATGEVQHWLFAYSPEKSWAAPFAGSPYTLAVIADSVGTLLRREDQWVAPLVPLPEGVPSPSQDSAVARP